MSHIIGMGIFRIGLNRTDLCCWRLTLSLNFVEICLKAIGWVWAFSNRKRLPYWHVNYDALDKLNFFCTAISSISV